MTQTNQVLGQTFSLRAIIIGMRSTRSVGWALLVFACIVPVWLIMSDLNNPGIFATGTNLLTNAGEITGVIGFVLYAESLVLSTRWRSIERLFGGLNVVYIVHHVVGGLSLVFLLFHPLFLAGSYALDSVYDAAQLLLPHGLGPLSALLAAGHPLHLLVVRQWAILLGEVALILLLLFLVLTFYVKLSYRLWYATHKLLGPLFILAGLHTILIDFDYGGGGLRWYMVIVFIVGVAAYVYRGLLGNVLVRRYAYTVDAITRPSDDVTELVLKPKQHDVSFKPGQFVFIRFPNAHIAGIGAHEWHPFSISSAPLDRRIRVTVKNLGDFTRHMIELHPGMDAEIEGAYGGFSYSNFKNKNQIWVAGGIGITPFIGMARSLSGTDNKVDLFYSVKTESELVDMTELEQLIAFEPNNLRIIPFISSKQGFLTVEYIEQAAGGLGGKELFLCGPPPMMRSLRRQLRDKGVSNAHIHSEEFSMS